MATIDQIEAETKHGHVEGVSRQKPATIKAKNRGQVITRPTPRPQLRSLGLSRGQARVDST